MTATNRQRGILGEREVVSLIKKRCQIHCERNLNQYRDGGTDINLTMGSGGFCIEVKRCKRTPSEGQRRKWIIQAIKESKLHHMPVVMWRSDGMHSWRVVAHGDFCGGSAVVDMDADWLLSQIIRQKERAIADAKSGGWDPDDANAETPHSLSF